MDLWIRNAEKTLLLKANEVIVRPIATSSGMHGQVICRDLVDYDSDLKNNEKLQFAVYVNNLVCGTYSTKLKALKVLDEVQNSLIDRYIWNKECYLGADVFIPEKDAELLPRTCAFYQMPADDTPHTPKDN